MVALSAYDNYLTNPQNNTEKTSKENKQVYSRVVQHN